MTKVPLEKYSMIEKLNVFSELTPQVKIMVVIFFCLSIIAFFSYIVIFTVRKHNKKYILPVATLFLLFGMYLSYSRLPDTNYELLFPRYTNQTIYKLGKNYFIENSSGTVYELVEGRTRVIEQNN